MALLSPIFNETHFKSDGTLASGYKIYTYIADSDIAATTYTTEDGDVAQANPIILNSRGELDNPIWLSDGAKYKFIFTNNSDVVIKTIDNVIGVSNPDAIQDQWIEFTGTATYISGTSFSLEGDQASIFDTGRALKLLTSAGTIYANVESSVFTTLTTITVNSATGLLDAGLTGTKPSYGVLSGTNPAIPNVITELTLTDLTATTADIETINHVAGTSIKGTNTNDNASAGQIGEYVESSILVASAISLTTNVAANITSISLTAGDWDVSGIARIHSNSATTSFTQGIGSISLTSATLDVVNQANIFSDAVVPTSGVNYCALTVPPARISVATTTTVYLVARAAFTVSTAQAYGVISARRRR